jgi:hypothetical protein
MAGKYALYLPFHIIAALETAGFSDAEIGIFVRGVIKYHLEGTLPRFEGRALNLLFSSSKPEFDNNIAKYENIVRKRSEAGKKGGAPRGNRNAAGNRGGGAPRGNQNTAKRKAPDKDPRIEPENKHKQMFEFEPKKQTQAKQADIESESDIDIDGGSTTAAGGGEVVFLQQPETTTTILNILSESKKAGFTLDRKIAGRILAGNPVDPAWLFGPFSFIEFAAATIQDSYPVKSPVEQKRLFISSLEWEDLRETYPAWREQREQEAQAKQQQEAAEAEQRRKDEARKNPPSVCDHCGFGLTTDSRSCPSCGWLRFFDDESGAWEFQEPVNLSKLFQKHLARAEP